MAGLLFLCFAFAFASFPLYLDIRSLFFSAPVHLSIILGTCTLGILSGDRYRSLILELIFDIGEKSYDFRYIFGIH